MSTSNTPAGVTENETGQEAKPTPEGITGEQAAQSTEQSANSETQQTKEEKKEDDKVNPAIQERIDEITAHRRVAERERDYWKNRALSDPKPAVTPPAEVKPQTTVDPDAPKLSDFQDYGDWVRANTQYEIQKTVKHLEGQKKAHDSKSQFQANAEAFKKTNPDFEQVAYNDALPVTQAMTAAIVGSPQGPAVAYFLGKNPDEAARIAALDPLSAAREIGKIEEKLKGPPPKNVSQAPKPLSSLPQSGGEATKVDLEKADMETYAASRAEAIKWRKPVKK